MRVHSILRLGPSLAVLPLVAAGFVACADSLHLNPPGTTTVPHDGGTGGSSTTCISNPDCSYPKPVCDTVKQTCVECLVISDCADKPGTVCSGGVCNCPNLENPAMPLTYCGNSAPACVDTTTDVNNCGGCGNACFGCAASKCTSPWVATSTTGAPTARAHHVAVWTGTQMFVWGGQGAAGALASGGLYDPAKKVWTSTSSTNAPQPRWDATAVWDDVHSRVLVFGGTDGTTYFPNGGQYDPATDKWTAITPLAGTDAGPGLAGRAHHTAVWAKPLTGIGTTTAAMIVWGGMTSGSAVIGDGAVYDPGTDTWIAAIPSAATPTARGYHAATWDNGSRMVVFGGDTGGGMADDETWNYIPSLPPAMWNGNQNTNPLAKRYQHTGTWDPGSMTSIFFGGWDGSTYYGDAAAFSLGAGNMWISLGAGSPASPQGRIGHTAVILTVGGSSQLVVFGGENAGTPLGDGWSVATAATGMWAALAAPGPSARSNHTAVSTGSTMIVWGGTTASGPTNTGGVYTAM